MNGEAYIRNIMCVRKTCCQITNAIWSRLFQVSKTGESTGSSGGHVLQRKQKIFGEPFDPKEEDFEPPFFPKTDEEKEDIRASLLKHFLFKHISSETLDTIIGAMFRVEVGAGEVVIREGEEGDYFYCIQSGLYEVYKDEDDTRKILGYYDEEGCFGELALMHQSGESTASAASTFLQRRQKIFGESFNPEEEEFEPPFFPKTDDEKADIRASLLKHFLFKHISSETLDIIIDAMFRVEVRAGEVVIREGEEGDYFYCIQSGLFEVDKHEDGCRRLLGYYDQEGCFGELALMHRVGRAVTVTAARDGVLWALDRKTFQRTLLGQAFKRRSHLEGMLSQFPLLQGLTDRERADVADSLVEKTYDDGEVIFKEGEPGDGMYWILTGHVLLLKGEKELKTLNAGDYFGEVSLLTNAGRAVTAKASGELKLLFLEAAAVERLLGPCYHIMAQRLPEYKAEMDKLLAEAGQPIKKTKK